MSDRSRSRVGVVLRLARRRERAAGVASAEADDAAALAARKVEESTERARSERPATTSVADFQRQNDVAELRAKQVLSDEEERRERMSDAFEARSALLDSVRRRQSLERVDARHEKVRAVIAAQAAQRALDEMGTRAFTQKEWNPE